MRRGRAALLYRIFNRSSLRETVFNPPLYSTVRLTPNMFNLYVYMVVHTGVLLPHAVLCTRALLMHAGLLMPCCAQVIADCALRPLYTGRVTPKALRKANWG